MRAVRALVRGWTRLYTLGLPSTIRERRLAEIESDLWEGEHDSSASATSMLARLVGGVPADLLWRAECARDSATLRPLFVLAALAMLCVTTWWLLSAPSLPPVPSAPPRHLDPRVLHPPPPPPPPPPPSVP